ncbi:hypothetical protein AWN77_20570 [Clostridioides difficile]|nr:hypothetical protein AWN77_20570 [Clostridioides difficile]
MSTRWPHGYSLRIGLGWAIKGRHTQKQLDKQKAGQKLEEIKQTLIPGIRKESLARSEKRGTSTERSTLSSVQVYGEAMLIQP